jgi:hypothetical protein
MVWSADVPGGSGTIIMQDRDSLARAENILLYSTDFTFKGSLPGNGVTRSRYSTLTERYESELRIRNEFCPQTLLSLN